MMAAARKIRLKISEQIQTLNMFVNKKSRIIRKIIQKISLNILSKL